MFSYLHTAAQQVMQDVGPSLHDTHISGGGVRTLAIGDGVDEAIAELLACAKQPRLDKAHHAVIYDNQGWTLRTGYSMATSVCYGNFLKWNFPKNKFTNSTFV